MSRKVYPYYTHLFMCPNCWEDCQLCEGGATTEGNIATCAVVAELHALADDLSATLAELRPAFDLEG